MAIKELITPEGDDIAADRARNVEMVACCDNMLARLDGIEGPEAADLRAQVRAVVAQLETLRYWIGCLERRRTVRHVLH